MFGLSNCLLSFNGADWSAHASEIHGLPAVWTEGLNDFEVTIDSQKKGPTRDLEWLASVDFKPVAIAVQATKPYALWLKTEIIPEKGITWWITHSDVNDAILTAKMTFYNVRDEVRKNICLFLLRVNTVKFLKNVENQVDLEGTSDAAQ